MLICDVFEQHAGESKMTDTANAYTTASCSPFSSSLPLIPGYTTGGLIQRGGQGAVYCATQDRTGQQVAIKLISAAHLQQFRGNDRRRIIAQLDKEIRIAASLNHPNVVKIYDAGECEDGFYFIMQFIPGGTLADRAPALNQIDAARIINSVANALQQAHAAGVLHLDIKPHNILIDELTLQPLLADFGLARLSQESPDANQIAGTPGYMAPEQAMGTDLDVRTDVYGLGATLYFLLTGTTAYKNVKLPYSKDQHKLWLPKPPREIRRGVNSDLAKICMQCLAFEPGDRFRNCHEVTQAISRFAETEDGRHIAKIGAATILTSPLFLIINALVYVQIIWGWAGTFFEPLIWLTMFSMYAVVFSVFGSISKLDRQSPEHVAVESLWAVWLAKFFAAMAVAGCLRLMASGGTSSPDGAEQTAGAILMCYPMFAALTGFALAAIAPRYWRPFYGAAILCWICSVVLMWTITMQLSLAPVIYGGAATCIAAIWGLKLRQLAHEQTPHEPHCHSPTVKWFPENSKPER